jgi:hypothetical protein
VRGLLFCTGFDVNLSAVLTLDRGGTSVPICRTRRPDVVRLVATAALADVRATADGETDSVWSALLRQEAERLDKGLRALGLDGEAGNGK